ncbi:hypothetical protein H257_09408 [Aphanomyces astaci]|uniref:Uncharacterized protein n=1 Tax=Aphanomyces astaci TaxID=112090 RepID=W4GBM9_APHAT|nr:hypothetical protein H257_09408 [Aphanomyces astaci]ETV76373.1 hypothetical protein H257_09408 [Aphanomyces astaci]|eukprot:XP_009833918.1 hypothetical protein H257_09408 [Aphanomyces astaci]
MHCCCHMFKDFLKPQQIKCTTVAIRHRIRTSLRSEAMGPIDVFERAETIEFCSLYLIIYFEILDPPESTRHGPRLHSVDK